MATKRIRALVLRTFEYGESSQIVHLFSREQGWLHAIAKGARRLTGSFHGGLDLLVLGDADIYERRPTRDLRTLASFDVVTHFPGLRRSADRFHNALHAGALLLAFAREEQPMPEVFELSVSALRLLEVAGPAEATAVGLAHEAMLLGMVGFAPELTRCVSCDRPARNIGTTCLSPLRGGLLCRGCRGEDRRATRLSGAAVASLVGLGQGPLARAVGLPVDRKLRREIRRALDSWTSTVLDRRLRTAAFL